MTFPYIYRWHRQGHKGQRCRVVARDRRRNSVLLEFADGYRMVTSGNALRKAPA